MSILTFMTGNQHKADQYQELLGVELIRRSSELYEIQSADPAEVARHKIEQAYEIVQGPVIVDDFGFCMEGLNNLPGTFTKFFVEEEASLDKLCKIAGVLENRNAKLVATIAYKDAGHTEVFIRELPGQVSLSPRGTRGIHTDRIFEPDGYGGKTRAELSAEGYAEVYIKSRPFKEFRVFLDKLELTKDKDIIN